MQAAEASELIAATVRATQVAVQCLVGMIGIQVNYAQNKTEAVMIWRGRGSRAARYHALVDLEGHLPLTARGSTGKTLRCVDAYTHLGTVRNYQARARADIQRRAQLARALYQPLRARVLRNPCLTVDERMMSAVPSCAPLCWRPSRMGLVHGRSTLPSTLGFSTSTT